MNFKLWFIDFTAAIVLLAITFYWWGTAPAVLLWIGAAGFVFFAIRAFIRSWKAFLKKSKQPNAS